LALSRKSPYTAAFNEVLVRLIEAGIVQYWKESIAYRSVDPVMSGLFERTGNSNMRPEMLRVENVAGAFLLLGVGELLCILVFISELSLKCLLHNQNDNQVFYASYCPLVYECYHNCCPFYASERTSSR
jgi:hypothetical protein